MPATGGRYYYPKFSPAGCSVSGFAQSSTNVKITLSDKVITVPKENFISLSFEDAEEQKDEFADDIYIVGNGSH